MTLANLNVSTKGILYKKTHTPVSVIAQHVFSKHLNTLPLQKVCPKPKKPKQKNYKKYNGSV